MICGDTLTYGWVYGWLGVLIDGSFFWHFDFLLKPPQPITGYFWEKLFNTGQITEDKSNTTYIMNKNIIFILEKEIVVF